MRSLRALRLGTRWLRALRSTRSLTTSLSPSPTSSQLVLERFNGNRLDICNSLSDAAVAVAVAAVAVAVAVDAFALPIDPAHTRTHVRVHMHA